MQRLEVSGAVRPLYGSLGVKGLILSSDWVNVTVFTATFTVLSDSNSYFFTAIATSSSP